MDTVKNTGVACRVDHDCHDRYHAKRQPSYCDRLLHNARGGWTIDTYGVVQLVVEDVDSGIMHSDHDVVAASASATVDGRRYTMMIATFNCEAQEHPVTAETWDQFFRVLERHFEVPSLHHFDAVCICLQESGNNNVMKHDLGRYLGEDFQLYKKTTDAGRSGMGRQFKVRCLVGLKQSVYAGAAVFRTSECLGDSLKYALCTKSVAMLRVQPATDSGPPPFRVMSAHLPIDTSSKTLGYGLREKALTYLTKRYLSIDDTWSVIIGDLNFRSHEGGFENDELVKHNLLERLNLQEPSPTSGKMAPTCKLKTLSKTGDVEKSSPAMAHLPTFRNFDDVIEDSGHIDTLTLGRDVDDFSKDDDAGSDDSSELSFGVYDTEDQAKYREYFNPMYDQSGGRYNETILSGSVLIVATLAATVLGSMR